MFSHVVSIPWLRNRRRPRVAAQLMATDDRWKQRRALRDLPDFLLRDIGITRAEAQAEADRPAWDVPVNWRR